MSLPDCLDPNQADTSGVLRAEAELLPGADKVTIEAIDGKFPDYRWVCRKTSEHEICINPFILINQLQTLCKALGLSKRDGSTVILGINDDENPLSLMGTSNGITARGYVMPLVTEKKAKKPSESRK